MNINWLEGNGYDESTLDCQHRYDGAAVEC